MRRSGQRGFTLIELMVVIAVMAIVLALAVPSFESVVNANRLAGGANEMIAALQTARMEAIRRNQRAEVCFSANANAGAGATCATSGLNGWITFVDADKSGLFDAGDTLLRTSTINAPLVLLSSPAVASKVIFRSDGMARNSSGALLNGTIDLCIPTSRPAENVRHVNIGSGSRVSVQPENKNSACVAPADPA